MQWALCASGSDTLADEMQAKHSQSAVRAAPTSDMEAEGQEAAVQTDSPAAEQHWRSNEKPGAKKVSRMPRQRQAAAAIQHIQAELAPRARPAPAVAPPAAAALAAFAAAVPVGTATGSVADCALPAPAGGSAAAASAAATASTTTTLGMQAAQILPAVLAAFGGAATAGNMAAAQASHASTGPAAGTWPGNQAATHGMQVAAAQRVMPGETAPACPLLPSIRPAAATAAAAQQAAFMPLRPAYVQRHAQTMQANAASMQRQLVAAGMPVQQAAAMLGGLLAANLNRMAPKK